MIGDLRNLENAVVRLLKNHPFYGHFLLQFRKRQVQGGHALGVTIENGTPVLCVNPQRLAEFSREEQRALLEHVLKHVLHLHMARRRGRHSHDWDLACDLAINPTIEGLPPQAARPHKFRLETGLAAEEYYRQLSRSFDVGNLEGRGFGDATRDAGQLEGNGAEREAGDSPAAWQSLDDHRIWAEADSTPQGLAEEVVRNMTAEAYRKSRGELPGDLRPLLEGLLAPSPIPWAQVLRQFVANVGRVGKRSTWQRAHRRFGQTTPGIRKRPRLNLLVAVDVSDSTNLRPLREAFAGELMRIARGRDSRITVLYAGSRIQRLEKFNGTPDVVQVFEGGGFTDLRPVFDYARSMQPRPAAVIYLTDGLGPAPETMEFLTLWVLTREGKKPAPWGVELRLER